MRPWGEIQLLSYGAEIFKKMTPSIIKEMPSPSQEAMRQLMEIWTHFIEEMEIKQLDWKLFQPYRQKVLSDLGIHGGEDNNQ